MVLPVALFVLINCAARKIINIFKHVQFAGAAVCLCLWTFALKAIWHYSNTFSKENIQIYEGQRHFFENGTSKWKVCTRKMKMKMTDAILRVSQCRKKAQMGARSIVRAWCLPGVGRNRWFKEERISVQNTTGLSVFSFTKRKGCTTSWNHHVVDEWILILYILL